MNSFPATFACLLVLACASAGQVPAPRILHRTVDLRIGEAQDVTLSDGKAVQVRLLDLQERRDDVNGAVRQAEVRVEVDGQVTNLTSGTYRLPVTLGRVQIDCPITKGYLEKSAGQNPWGLLKDARLRLWPAGSAWIPRDSFVYPARQRWFASYTQMANEPVYVDGGELPAKKEIYYHFGLDIGGSEGLVDVVSATEGIVTSSGNEVLAGQAPGVPAERRYDVVYILDARGWYCRYSHLKFIDPAVRPGARIALGQKLGVLGKEGGSGGWSHLHFDISARQPSGLWGIEEGYAFLWQAYEQEHPRELVAVARPHALVWAGQKVTLDGSRSRGQGLRHEWTFTEGGRASGERVERTYDTPGSYCETLKVTDAAGRVDYDFTVVQVIDRAHPDQPPPTIHATYAPTFGIRPGDPVVFKVRTFRDKAGGETWDFGDGTPAVKVKSDANADRHAPNGYAEARHMYEKPGHYLASVEHVSAEGIRAVARLQVRVGIEKAATGSSESRSRPAGQRGEMTLWYRQPAVKWLEALPLGNGLTAAMVFGGTKTERIALNNSSFWSGKPHDYDDPNAGKYFEPIKALMAEQKFQEAEKMVDDHFWGIPKGQQAYQPVGDLSLAFDGVGEVADYRRELDMETGVATVTYRSGGVWYNRETFISYPDRVLVVRLWADQPGSVSVEARFKSPAQFVDKITATPGQLVLDGTWRRPGSGTNWLIAPVEGPGLRFEAAMMARAEGGQAEAAADSVRIRKADAVTLILTTATSHINYHDISGDPAAQCQKILADCAGKDYASLRRRHEADFRGLMGRVHLHVGDTAQNDRPIDERLAAARAGSRDPNLEALVFQFGRYILAASSRAGGQPANLQGIWDEDVLPPWGSKYTININTEMNYWPAEVCNLPECAQPLFDMIQDISEAGARTAKVYYGVDGWVTHHNLDLWRGTAPVDAARFGMWPVGGAWLCQSLWEHYAFGGDVDFLRKYYPVLRDCARFLLNIMIVEPRHHWLVTPFSMSPEHGYFDANGKAAVLSPSPTMDVAIMRELFPHCIEASRILGVDADFRAKLEDALTKIPPYQIGSSGFVQEWIEDWKTGPQGHNVSPNFAFYPGCSITLRGNPDFAAAYQEWMEAHRPGGGFIVAWGIAMWARLERGDQVAKCIEAYMGRGPASNLHNAGANQSDASFGFAAGVAEALVQSHAGEISLLPALPAGWDDGSVSGLRARDGYDVSLQWQGGKLQTADLHGLKGGATRVRYGQKTATITIKSGGTAHLNADLAAGN